LLYANCFETPITNSHRLDAQRLGWRQSGKIFYDLPDYSLDSGIELRMISEI